MAQARFSDRIGDIRVSDVMDTEPVAIPDHETLAQAENDFFLRYGWPWFPVVDSTGKLVGVVSREVGSVPESDGAGLPGGIGDGPRRRRQRPPCPPRGSARGSARPRWLSRLGAVMAVTTPVLLRADRRA